ncbi:MAG TPA: hypothetical protein VNK43_06920 [Gemmatimonadales bacterium]|nr:hypothetical protein [Gemmatimonadales bacterium]
MDDWDAPSVALLELMARLPRGPKREGAYALWLTTRIARDRLGPEPYDERASRRRVAALEARISSLALPAPLRRGLAAAVAQLEESTREAAVQALAQLVAPARDTVGPEAADALAATVRAARPQPPGK